MGATSVLHPLLLANGEPYPPIPLVEVVTVVVAVTGLPGAAPVRVLVVSLTVE